MDFKNKILPVIVDYLVMTVGVVLYVLAWDMFMIPNGVTNGGLTGLCAIVEFATGGAIPVGWTFPIINALLIIVAMFVVGNTFGIRTIFVIALSSVLFEVMPNIPGIAAVEGNLFFVNEKILIPVIGGLMEAFGISLILERGGSTGGTDILAVIVNKFYPVSLGRVYLVCDIVLISSLLFIDGKTFQDVVYGYLAMITFALAVDYIQLGRKSSVKILIFSERYKQIADFIINEMDRGVTALNAVGWYTGQDKKVLLVIVRKTELRVITKAVKSVDPKAFVSVSPASSVYGEGFEEIKTGIDRKKKNNGNS